MFLRWDFAQEVALRGCWGGTEKKRGLEGGKNNPTPALLDNQAGGKCFFPKNGIFIEQGRAWRREGGNRPQMERSGALQGAGQRLRRGARLWLNLKTAGGGTTDFADGHGLPSTWSGCHAHLVGESSQSCPPPANR